MLLYGTEDTPNEETLHGGGKKGNGNSKIKNVLTDGSNIEDDISNHLDSEASNRGWKDPATRRDDVTRTTMDPLGNPSSGCISFSKSTSQCIGSLFLFIFTSSFTFDFWELGHLIISFSVLPFKYLINIILSYLNEISPILKKSALINECLGEFNNELNKTDLGENNKNCFAIYKLFCNFINFIFSCLNNFKIFRPGINWSKINT